MEDPVLLPTSNVIVDRSTIRAHLLGDTRDPFNRKPLSMDMVQPGNAYKSPGVAGYSNPMVFVATELKNKIVEWRAEQKNKKNNVTSMDTSP